MTLEEIVEALVRVKGVSAAAIVDYGSGMMLASKNLNPDFDLEIAAAGNVSVMRNKIKVMNHLELGDTLHDIQVDLQTQYHFICPCSQKEGMFIYMVADRQTANLSIIRRSLFHAETLVV
ncbi:MAG: hypothetical protein Q4B82_00275 [Alysiella sp.]|uniref:hypothetical protein n=1 Tax=Alysiella sp. TaxID=1872483 RepID=UPI0026DBCFDE|nr:hypothetical protein [Alysiella sp.]MDO4433003.1 hypothetical protein [Alysiella sp.]